MTNLKLALFSSSRAGNGAYLQATLPVLKNFLGNSPLSIAFIPFASVDKDYEAYTEKVRTAFAELGHQIKTAEPSNALQIIKESDVVMIGGGNSFKLLHDLYELNLVELIRQKVHGGTYYIGWSAGSNLAGPTIYTTNDMPIIQPKSFNAFGFIPFQVNPHYHNIIMEGFNGETRDQRLEEFLKMNSDKKVICLPEGTALVSDGRALRFFGEATGVILSIDKGQLIKKEIHNDDEL